MDKPVTVYARIDDPNLASEFKATLEREGRTMQSVTERALRIYIAQSKAAEAQKQAAEASAQAL